MAKPITISISHTLGKTEARRRIEAGFAAFEEKFAALGVSQFRQGWSGDRLSFSGKGFGQTIQGALDVLDDAIKIEVILPALLAGFGEKVAGAVREQGRLLLEKK